MEHPCDGCGETDPVVLDFHHVKGQKLFCVSQFVDCSDKRLWDEIAKCIVLCANCHRRRHHKARLEKKLQEDGVSGLTFGSPKA